MHINVYNILTNRVRALKSTSDPYSAQVPDDVIINLYKNTIVHLKSIMCNIHCMKY